MYTIILLSTFILCIYNLATQRAQHCTAHVLASQHKPIPLLETVHFYEPSDEIYITLGIQIIYQIFTLRRDTVSVYILKSWQRIYNFFFSIKVVSKRWNLYAQQFYTFYAKRCFKCIQCSHLNAAYIKAKC